jgi:hypothetical protein
MLWEVYNESWLTRAASRDWDSGRNNFVSCALELCGMKVPKLSRRNRNKANAFVAKPARSLDYDSTVVPWMRMRGEPGEHLVAVEILCDSELVVKWILGHAKVKEAYCLRVGAVQNCVQGMWQAGVTTPRLPWMDVIRHIYREMNSLADAAAKEAFTQQTSYWKELSSMNRFRQSLPKYLRIYTDGSHRDGLASSGMVVFGAWEASTVDPASLEPYMSSLCGTFAGMADASRMAMPVWEPILEAGKYLGQATIVTAELDGVEEAVAFLRGLRIRA